MTAAVQRDGAGQQALMAGDRRAARSAFAEAAELYRRSWEAAPPSAYGRLVGMLKASVLAGAGASEAAYVREALGEADPESATASYVQALAALILDRDAEAQSWAARMRAVGNDAFARTAAAIEALALRDEPRFGEALGTIVGDFEARAAHLTGVAIADTAVMLAELAGRRGMAAPVQSPVMPAR